MEDDPSRAITRSMCLLDLWVQDCLPCAELNSNDATAAP